MILIMKSTWFIRPTSRGRSSSLICDIQNLNKNWFQHILLAAQHRLLISNKVGAVANLATVATVGEYSVASSFLDLDTSH